MGCSDSTIKQKHDLKVATLNFSGICLSPFEYHDCSPQKDLMSSKFEEILKQTQLYKQQGDKFKWELGKIDQKFQKQRYTPIYNKGIGILHGKLVNKKQFDECWDQYFAKIPEQKINKFGITQEHKKQCRLFDWICYQTLINTVYTTTKSQQKFDIKKVKDYDSKKYEIFLNQWLSKPYLNNNQKLSLVIQFIKGKDLDVIFLQQANVFDKSNNSWESSIPKNFNLKKEQCQSIIIYNVQKFGQLDEDIKFHNEFKKQLNFNNDSIYVKTKDYLLISVHLTSKDPQNKNQGAQMFQTLLKIKKNYPNLKIILGADANYFIQKRESNDFKIFPESSNNITTIKKRTAMQPQTKKANTIAKQCKDHIISTQKLVQGHVLTIRGQQTISTQYLPNDKHPFDHYLLTAKIINLV